MELHDIYKSIMVFRVGEFLLWSLRKVYFIHCLCYFINYLLGILLMHFTIVSRIFFASFSVIVHIVYR